MNQVDKPFDNRAAIEDVVAVYRLVLGRNPERAGFAHWKGLIEKGHISVDRLYSAFLNSEEFRAKQKAEKQVVAVDCGGYFVCVRKGEQDFGQTIVAIKGWEAHIARVVSETLKEGDTFVDVGANVGIMAFAGAKRVGETGVVVAVEPNPDNLQMLYAGILENGFRNVRVLPFAASDQAAVVSLGGGTSNSFTVLPSRKGQHHAQSVLAPQDGQQHVQACLLDDLLSHLGRIDLVKMDIEGHEPHALNGFRRLLSRHKPVVIVEFNPHCLKHIAGLDPRACLDQLFDLFDNVRLIETSGKLVGMARPADVWAHWQLKNQEAVRTGLLPEGMVHFDILAKAK